VDVLRQKPGGLWKDEWGFTLPEVLITIVLMGIVCAIATSTWNSIVDSREVDSAANQLVADLRLAHSTATNRLADQVVSLTADSSRYSVPGSASLRDLDDDPDNHLVTVDTTATITFKPNATAEPAGAPITFRVQSADDEDKFHDIEVVPATSRVQIDGA
jgi:prepilin-type N-terminal cleavage/methylation domain-containing protein